MTRPLSRLAVFCAAAGLCAACTAAAQVTTWPIPDGIAASADYRVTADGIDPCRCRDLVIRNSFVHTQDDCLAPKFWIEGMTVSNMTLWSDCASPIRSTGSASRTCSGSVR